MPTAPANAARRLNRRTIDASNQSTRHGRAAITNTTPDVGEQPWTQAFSAKDPEAFAKAFAPDVVLEATTLRKPIQGRDLMAYVMATAKSKQGDREHEIYPIPSAW